VDNGKLAYHPPLLEQCGNIRSLTKAVEIIGTAEADLADFAEGDDLLDAALDA